MSVSRFTSRATGFTLVELVAALLVVGLSLASVAPLVVTMTDTSRRAVARGEARHGLNLAMERVARMIREIPRSSGGPAPAIASFGPRSLELESGAGVSLSGTTLTLTDADGNANPLCTSVEAFSLTYLEEDGLTEASEGAGIQRVHVSIERGGLRLATVVFLRVSEFGP